MIKTLIVFGTRPEAIKMAPLVKELQEDSNFDVKVCVTAQHRQMLDQVLEIFDIKPGYDLDIMKYNQSLFSITSDVLLRFEKVLEKERPDIVLVHGDTTTTFASALASFYFKTKVGHVEAGLRTYNKYSPFPEEMNRKLTAALSDLHFAPTKKAKLNLMAEGVKEESIFVTGNTVIDTLKFTVKEDYVFKEDSLNNINFSKRVILLTAHRRENFGKPLENIFEAVLKIANEFDDVVFVYPVHLNPNVKNVAYRILKDHPRIKLINPIDVDDMHNLIARSYLVLTDSGGLQEEAPSLGKPVVVLRDTTERPEAVLAKTVVVAGTQKERIIQIVTKLLTDEEEYLKMAKAINPYGDGNASKRIKEALLFYFGKSSKKPEEFCGSDMFV
ncbi:UDP-N-acetylglucosamine 2-epimerase (non-hydrolysing) [Caldicellulosiruptor bescii]|jgi:UDP-N-acetylglucosamine 2-epimerase (non-hydrolysing)|uniref:UDP-N-acetylglucosamine 2-epimerase (non-hydrolyzing) n=2 Tax=Caldicellulosiruptor bescii TaxID=31899 RepID=B9ML25_CALBD|nr:UDP-N-acetylglucosamine 2-epimerase (non-hydrolyzing) [Caldicellulosiruptor bescii]ACM61033.1 UDP-N-acetylglucosamine 2-epimerase [Caldicellulosiruptor bescii DSM 6725]PBC89153.1 UDP-N-acetylglucosamine 2-epimerase (non-hydrolysing) [Caldicellulosiruptor bescii]PBC91365.1 UDP-N-acetylglucosamine 2-epimerase (non-hydrolysing) [Caldicellulosiruptor bescii]PBD03223.1 UDP-N-acetylglucosamine 2-epimerase (non-hydrolysing) [Caldicellulosiruptor bescii]PBD07163.1 UDP-N-acetylglucosamine 2-epimeras